MFCGNPTPPWLALTVARDQLETNEEILARLRAFRGARGHKDFFICSRRARGHKDFFICFQLLDHDDPVGVEQC